MLLSPVARGLNCMLIYLFNQSTERISVPPLVIPYDYIEIWT